MPSSYRSRRTSVSKVAKGAHAEKLGPPRSTLDVLLKELEMRSSMLDLVGDIAEVLQIVRVGLAR
jgi:hypothetical protein